MRQTLLLKILLIAVLVTTASPAHAVLNLTNIEVQGELFNGASPTNLFDPTNGHVPPGFGNSPATPPPGGSGEASALVSDSIVEFGYQGGQANTSVQVDFHNNGVVNGTISATPWTLMTMHFNSPAFTQMVTFTATGSSSPDFIPGYGNNTLTFTFTGPAMATTTFSGFLNIQGTPPPQIPEPASLTLLGLGIVGIIALSRKLS